MTAPIAATEIWQAVMDRAGHQCQCTTERHPAHRSAEGRCWRATTLGHRLIAGPLDPGPHPDRSLTALPVEQLMAWCLPCWDHTVATSRKHAKRAALTQRNAPSLW